MVSSRVDSSMGPMRILYTPNAEFTLVVEMHNSMFSAKVIGLRRESLDLDSRMTRKEAEERVHQIDASIEDLDRERAALVAERSTIVTALSDNGEADGAEGTERTIEREV